MGFSEAKKRADSLIFAAQSYRQLGYSVIPTYGDSDPTRPKVAGVAWSQYQRRYAQESDFTRWFTRDGFAGLAIVTGGISRLLVIDFDDESLAKQFARRFPQLTETRTVLSAGRGLPHYYYQLPFGTNLNSRQYSGVDIQANGRYVVTAPTTINGEAYRIFRGGVPICLDKRQIKAVLAFFDTTCGTSSKSSVVVSNHSNQTNKDPVSGTTVPLSNPVPPSKGNQTPAHLLALYRHFAPQIGRNNALFQLTCKARTWGWSIRQVAETLLNEHIHQPASHRHTSETPAQRRYEATKTIESAFRRTQPSTNPVRQQQQTQVSVPNPVREVFLQRGQTAVLRVIEGLLLAGVKEGVVISQSAIEKTLKGVVGRYSILKALSTTYLDKSAIFELITPSAPPDPHTAVANGNQQVDKQKCILFRVTSPDKNKRGRPSKQYLMPKMSIICSKLNVKYITNEAIQQEDLASATAYRQAIHRELLQRRPGLYTRKWLAKRIGVSVRTCQRYNQADEINVQPMFIETPISWRDIGKIPDESPLNGTFLRDEQGKRYPALRCIATHLLAKKHHVTYVRQDRNYYWVGNNLPVVSVAFGIHPQQAEYDEQREKVRQFIERTKTTELPRIKATTDAQPITIPKPPQSAHKQSTTRRRIKPRRQTIPKKRKSYYRRPLAHENQEHLAQKLYRVVWNSATEEKARISQANARRLVEQYGSRLVQQAITTLDKRQNITNPAGFVHVWLRSTFAG